MTICKERATANDIFISQFLYQTPNVLTKGRTVVKSNIKRINLSWSSPRRREEITTSADSSSKYTSCGRYNNQKEKHQTPICSVQFQGEGTVQRRTHPLCGQPQYQSVQFNYYLQFNSKMTLNVEHRLMEMTLAG
jgi:hypothetical protein